MKIRTLIAWVVAYAVAMAFLESTVVVYLRELFYPNGFSFPLAEMDSRLAVTEILREAATLIMLVAVAVIAGKRFTERFAWFIFAFGVWDIFYYIFLWLLIGWPGSLMEWDVLFLIPVTWTGPVITPVIISLIMILLALLLLFYPGKPPYFKLSGWHWVLLIAGSLVVITAFAWDYSAFILQQYSIRELINLPDNEGLFRFSLSYVPVKFNWPLFTAGAFIIIAVPVQILITLYESRKTVKKII